MNNRILDHERCEAKTEAGERCPRKWHWQDRSDVEEFMRGTHARQAEAA